MSRAPVLVDVHASAELAASVSAMHGVHHLLVVDEGELVGVVRMCDLAEAEPGDSVSSLMRAPATVIGEDDRLRPPSRSGDAAMCSACFQKSLDVTRKRGAAASH